MEWGSMKEIRNTKKGNSGEKKNGMGKKRKRNKETDWSDTVKVKRKGEIKRKEKEGGTEREYVRKND